MYIFYFSWRTENIFWLLHLVEKLVIKTFLSYLFENPIFSVVHYCYVLLHCSFPPFVNLPQKESLWAFWKQALLLIRFVHQAEWTGTCCFILLLGWVFVFLWQTPLFEAIKTVKLQLSSAKWPFRREFYCMGSPYAPECKNQKLLDLKRHRKQVVGKNYQNSICSKFLMMG